MNNTVKVLKPTGILDGRTTNQLRQEINDLIRQENKNILIDCQAVNFMNSSGIGALVATLKLVKNAGAKMYLCSLTDQVKMIFNLTKMDRVFEIYTDSEEFTKKLNLLVEK